MRKGVPGPGFLPFFSGLALIFVSLFVLIPALVQRGKARSGDFFPERDSLRRLLSGPGRLVRLRGRPGVRGIPPHHLPLHVFRRPSHGTEGMADHHSAGSPYGRLVVPALCGPAGSATAQRTAWILRRSKEDSMDFVSHVYLSFQVALEPMNLLLCFLGCLMGTFVGVLPGLGPAASISLLLPITFKLPPNRPSSCWAGSITGPCTAGPRPPS